MKTAANDAAQAGGQVLRYCAHGQPIHVRSAAMEVRSQYCGCGPNAKPVFVGDLPGVMKERPEDRRKA